MNATDPTHDERLTIELRPRMDGKQTDIRLNAQIETIVDRNEFSRFVQALNRWTGLRVAIALYAADPCANRDWFAAWVSVLSDPAMHEDHPATLF